MRVNFFVKMFKIESRFPKCKKKKTGKIFFWESGIWRCCNKLSLLRNEYLSSAVNVLTNSPKIFPNELPSEWSINMVKVLLFRFQQSFGPFTMLLVAGSSETGRFRYLFNHLFRSLKFQKYISYEGDVFFWKYSKLNLDFQNA